MTFSRTAFIIALALPWLVTILQTFYHWGNESYYNFGLYVPFLTAYLLYSALKNLPLAINKYWKHYALFAGIITFTTFLPANALSEVNPFWRVPLWIQGISAYAVTLLLIRSLHGWAGVKKSLFPLFFLLTMIPWPYRMETEIVQSLTGFVVELSLPLIQTIGYPVHLAGNSFVLGEIAIGVNEACSGIRSFQALFMVALFLGSIFGHSIVQRIVVVFFLPIIVILVNSIRAAFLAIVVIEEGHEAYDKWHDPAGYIAFIFSMAIIYGLIELMGFLLAKKKIEITEEKVETPKPESKPSINLRRLITVPAVFAAFPIFSYTSVEAWFQYHEMRTPVNMSWGIQLPEEKPGELEHLPIHQTIENLLGYDYGFRFAEKLTQKAVLEVYFYGYEPENKLGSVSSYGHSPAICMESTGCVLLREFETINIEVEGLRIPLRHFLFQLPNSTKKLNVFWVVWENKNMQFNHEELASLNYKTQLKQLLSGRRDFSRHVFLASISNAESHMHAEQLIEGTFLRLFIRK